MGAESRLKELDIDLPEAPKPVAAYVPAVRTGRLVFVSGQVAFVEGELPARFVGKVGEDVSLEDGYDAARLAAINALAVLRDAAGGTLDNVSRIVRVEGWVASADDFTGQPKVVNGASELLGAVFDEAGQHARVALGANVLPLGACVEVAIIAEVDRQQAGD